MNKVILINKFKIVAACLLALVLFVSCWDNVELENRGFVTAIAIDKADEGGYKATLEIPLVSNEKSTEAGKSIEVNQSKSLARAIYGTDVLTDKQIYLAHMKMAVLGEEILSDDKMLRQVADTLLRDKDVSRKVLVLAAKDQADAIVRAESDSEKLTGVYISNYYKKNNPSIMYRQDLDKLTKSFAEDGLAIIPRIDWDGSNLALSGGAVMKDYALSGWLDSDAFQGFLWVDSHGKGTKLEVDGEDGIFVIHVDKYETAMEFHENNGTIYCTLTINMTADVEEAPESFTEQDTEALIQKGEERIKEDINSAYDALYNQMHADGFGMESALKKKEPMLHKVYFENMGTSYMDIPVIVHIHMTINNTGAISAGRF